MLKVFSSLSPAGALSAAALLHFVFVASAFAQTTFPGHATPIRDNLEFYAPPPAAQPPAKAEPILCRSDRLGFDLNVILVPHECANSEGACNCKNMENENFWDLVQDLYTAPVNAEGLRLISDADQAKLARSRETRRILGLYTEAGFKTCEELFCK